MVFILSQTTIVVVLSNYYNVAHFHEKEKNKNFSRIDTWLVSILTSRAWSPLWKLASMFMNGPVVNVIKPIFFAGKIS